MVDKSKLYEENPVPKVSRVHVEDKPEKKKDLLAIEKGWIQLEIVLQKYGQVKKRWQEGCQEPDYLTYVQAREFVRKRGTI